MIFKIHAETLAEFCPPPQARGLSARPASDNLRRMFRSKRDKENKRFYLFPGQGGAALRRKKRRFLIWAAIAALLLSAVLGGLFYWLDRQRPF